MLDSLVRVSRRVDEVHFVIILGLTPITPQSKVTSQALLVITFETSAEAEAKTPPNKFLLVNIETLTDNDTVFKNY